MGTSRTENASPILANQDDDFFVDFEVATQESEKDEQGKPTED